MTDCIFCKIAAGEMPSFKLCEDTHSLAFMDINPAQDGHALVIPKEHSKDLYQVSPTALSATLVTAQRVAKAVRETLQPDGMNLVQCNGTAAAQSVLHFHVHVLPRLSDDGLALNWGPRPGDLDAIGQLAEKIRTNLERA
jgi:histidine triad (HIT) family protein